jgi:dipeptidyl aminopeptidase/acylaminoacyl peptidase
MTPIQYTASDGVVVPAYLTLPGPEDKGPYPTILLPHGGPQSRDVWGFGWLTQFLVANGFAVLQSNFRGSGGYGRDWVGEGGFKSWRLVIADLEAGARAVVERGIADPERMCIVGWSYGGYAALMSVLEHSGRYRCVVSIAGVTDPGLLAKDLRRYLGGRAAAEEMIGRDAEVLARGSPKKRAAEFQVPVLLFHGDEDVNVPVDHSRKLAKALRRKKRSVGYFEYADAEHDIWRDSYRIDMLERMGDFLHEHLADSGDQATGG